jgi:hypothetical protein
LSLRDRGLRGQTAEDKLTGSIQPMPGERVDHFAPDPLLENIKIHRRLRATPTRDAGDDGKRS